MVKTVLIVGGSGFIGTHLAKKLREGYRVFGTYHKRQITMPGVTYFPLKLHDMDWVKRLIYTVAPDVVIYAAGGNDVQLAEENPREAEKMSVAGPAAVLKAAIIFQPKFIYLSNSYVFDGHRGNYHEPDIVLAQSNLGKFKIAGENFIRGRSPNYTILRLSPVFGRGNGRSLTYLDQLRIQLSRGQRFESSSMEVHSFAAVGSVVELIARLADGGPRNKTLHFGGLTKMSHFELAQAFAKRFGFDPGLVAEKKNEGHAQQTLDYSLNSSEVAQNLKIKPLLVEEGFDLLEKELVAAP